MQKDSATTRTPAAQTETSERTARILAAHARGLSYRQIGEQFGISRERAYQIVKRAIPEAAASRNSNQKRNQRPVLFSDTAVRLGVWLVYARARTTRGQSTPGDQLAPQLTAHEYAELIAALELSDNQVADAQALGRQIAAARATALTQHPRALTAQEYARACTELHERWNIAHAAHPWPVSQQTVAQRLGAGRWNRALADFGFTLNNAVRGAGATGRGARRYAEADYRAALRAFRDDCAGAGVNASYAAYRSWVKSEAAASRTRPSANAVRQHYGSWGEALSKVD